MSGQRRPRPSQGRTRRHLRASAGLGLALAILTLGLAAPTTAQAAVGCTPTGVAQDLDRDGRPDVVASGTNHDLEIAYANGKRAVIRRADFPNPPAFTFFPTTIAVDDFKLDGCLDIALTAAADGYVEPLDNDGEGPVTGGKPGKALLFLVMGTPTGLAPSSHVLELGDSAGDSAVVVLSSGQRVLALGMPSTGPGGSVALIGFAGDGSPRPPVLVNQDTPGMPGSEEADDMFGFSVAGWGKSLAIGVPGEAIGTRKRAGGVAVVTILSLSPLVLTGVGSSQNASGVATAASTNDVFGWSVDLRGSVLAVGVPEENAGGVSDAGAVQLFRYSASANTLTPTLYIHQGTAGIPGTNEFTDRFGEQVALGYGLRTAGRDALVVTVPGEDHSGLDNAGSWVVLDIATHAGSSYSLSTSGITGAAVRSGGAFMSAATLEPARGSTRGTTVVGLPWTGRGRVVVGPAWQGAWRTLYSSDPAGHNFGWYLPGTSSF